ncbi:glycoside hydrolase family 71 protein [Piedraia hortae CBS 480.64]|uniref:Glycoside hydrolase family 71 protein n=1 Tax=Piedraia hortae CBS 480.64 TaxID=1314780 RepID=A0A6A7CA91_9PEZI|nr:glycoside hydrolase family 71 protein [Piedraia hortae CBS 480.64]
MRVISSAAAVLAVAMAQVAVATDVFAHFMVQNAYAYDVNQWKQDMNDAKSIGIDGFALNWIPPNCQWGLAWTADRIDDAFEAAEQVGFSLMHSFDMSYSECDIYWNQTYMQDVLTKSASSKAAYKWNNNILVSTYGGDQVDQYGDDFFAGLKRNMAYSNMYITLAPALTKYSLAAQDDPTGSASKLMSDYKSIDGYLNWQAWPLNTGQNISTTPDQAFKNAIQSNHRSGPYIMAVSPWQYKDLNNGNPLDSWVAYSDTLYPTRFQSLVGNNAFQPDLIEILTWNDFCESHYLRDLPDQYDTSKKDYIQLGEMGAYVWGQDHSPWRIMTKYYLTWLKTGSPPPIFNDQVIFWHRVHPKSAVCIGGSSQQIRNTQYPQDAVFAWALVKEPSTVSMSVGSNQYWNFHADGMGPVMNMVPFPSSLGGGVTPQVSIIRNGQTIHFGNSSHAISSDCAYQNFNPVVSLVGDST